MSSIRNSSIFLQFTCGYKNGRDLNTTDYLQIQLENIKSIDGGKSVDIIEFKGYSSKLTLDDRCGKIGEYYLAKCQIELNQDQNWPLNVYFTAHPSNKLPNCTLADSEWYGGYNDICPCLRNVHRCVQNGNSTTQLWFGTRTEN